MHADLSNQSTNNNLNLKWRTHFTLPSILIEFKNENDFTPKIKWSNYSRSQGDY